MQQQLQVQTIGSVRILKNEYTLRLHKEFIPGLNHIKGFSHLQVLWWGNLYDTPELRKNLLSKKLFKKGPDQMGVFATRSPVRPNPILLSIIQVRHIEFDKGIIHTPFMDAEDGTPILDIKPYNKMERVRNCEVPEWCRHWPEWYEDAADYNWEEEINME